jgi:hypothetical protein
VFDSHALGPVLEPPAAENIMAIGMQAEQRVRAAFGMAVRFKTEQSIGQRAADQTTRFHLHRERR